MSTRPPFPAPSEALIVLADWIASLTSPMLTEFTVAWRIADGYDTRQGADDGHMLVLQPSSGWGNVPLGTQRGDIELEVELAFTWPVTKTETDAYVLRGDTAWRELWQALESETIPGQFRSGPYLWQLDPRYKVDSGDRVTVPWSDKSQHMRVYTHRFALGAEVPVDPTQAVGGMEGVVAGEVCTGSVTLYNEFGEALGFGGNDVRASVTGANAGSHVAVSDAGDGSYTLAYPTTVAGTDAVNVSVNLGYLTGLVALGCSPLYVTIDEVPA